MVSNYISIGIVLALTSGLSLLAFCVCIIHKSGKKKPQYYGKLSPKEHKEAFLHDIQRAYDTTGDIKGMLLLVQTNWGKGATGKRVSAALDYLQNSRYRDYETTLFYLSDQSDSCNTLLQEILKQEIGKQRGLICRN